MQRQETHQGIKVQAKIFSSSHDENLMTKINFNDNGFLNRKLKTNFGQKRIMKHVIRSVESVEETWLYIEDKQDLTFLRSPIQKILAISKNKLIRN